MEGPPPRKNFTQSDQINAAIKAIREKPALPEIDFTLHTMEDGSTVNTQERVCKGMK
jgi:serine/threonine-protein phosphatase 2B catalytic subunit